MFIVFYICFKYKNTINQRQIFNKKYKCFRTIDNVLLRQLIESTSILSCTIWTSFEIRSDYVFLFLSQAFFLPFRSISLYLSSSFSHRCCGLVVKASARQAGDRGFESRLSQSQDYKIWEC